MQKNILTSKYPTTRQLGIKIFSEFTDEPYEFENPSIIF